VTVGRKAIRAIAGRKARKESAAQKENKGQRVNVGREV
jgi:hypothetical protein